MPFPQENAMLTPQERRLKILLRILALLFGLAIFGYLLPALVGPNKAFFVQLPFVTNSVVKVGVLGLLAFFAAADVRRFRLLTVLVIWGHVISELAVIAVLIWGRTDYLVALVNPFTWVEYMFPVTQLLWGSIILDGVIIALLVWFYVSAEKSYYKLLYLSPVQYRTLSALADVVIMGEKEIVSPEQVARNVDRYLAAFRARSKWIMKLVLAAIQYYPLLSLRPPFSFMKSNDRFSFIKRRFYQDVTLRLIPGFWRTIVQGMIRMGKQLSYLGYYNDPRTFESVGYIPFSQRKDKAKRIKASPLQERLPLHVTTSSDMRTETLIGDVVVVGSGAAASVLAYGLAKAGREVLMIERGDFVDPSQFTEDEVEMLTQLYSEGALQLTRDFRFQVLQGSCVGGTTVVNNGVCFDLPPEVLDLWNDPHSIDARLDPPRIWKSFREVRRLLGVEHQRHQNLNKGAKYFSDGVKKLGLHVSPNKLGEVHANIHGCLGCGYCNIGCPYGKKLSMLDTVLPLTQRDFSKDGREALKIIAGCEALRLRGNEKSITSVSCRFKDGRRIEVLGSTFVLAAGAVSSSVILLRSGVGGRRVGKNLSFNMGSPITAVFNDVVDSYDGLQLSHYLKLSPSRGYVIETWFNPPLAQALSMPGWFEDHYNNMRRYNRMTSVGVLVGTEPNAEVRLAGLTGRDVNYVPRPGDLEKLISGLVLAGEIFFVAGARSVLPSTFKYYEFSDVDQLRQLPHLVQDPSDITLGTGHPQGGNILSGKRALGVVDPEFRVYGYENLFVCDASVFPSSVGVNPQLTVMALAHYAVPFVAQSHP